MKTRRNTYRRRSRRAKRTAKRTNRHRRHRRCSTRQRGGAMRPRDPIPFSTIVTHRYLEDEMTGVERMVPYETFQQMKENDELT